MKQIFITIPILFFAPIILSLHLYGGVPSGYYDTANGLTGTSLQAALHEIINDHTSMK